MPMESRGPEVFVRDSLECSKEVSASVAWYTCSSNFRVVQKMIFQIRGKSSSKSYVEAASNYHH